MKNKIMNNPYLVSNTINMQFIKKIFVIIIFAVLVLQSSSSPAAENNQIRYPENALKLFFDNPKLKNSKMSICVRDCFEGSIIVNYNADTPLIPASNMK